MDSDTRFGINTSKVIYEIFEEEALLVNLDNGNYYSLDSVGTDILRLVEQGLPLASFVEILVQRYEGSRTEIEKGMQELLTQLEKEGLVVPQDRPGTDAALDQAEDAKTNIQTKKPQFSTPKVQVYTDMQDLILLDPIHEVDESGWPVVAPDHPIEES